MALCLFNQAGAVVLHRHLRAAPEPFLPAIVRARAALVVCVEGLCTWSWRADLCRQEGIPVVLGHALSMTAMPGGKATNETIDAHQMAVLRRGGLLPQAAGSPAERRATRDVRRRHRTRTRAELWAHRPQTTRQSHLPAISQTLADTANRAGVAERCPEPAVPQRLEVDRARLPTSDPVLTDLERSLVTTTTAPAAPIVSRRRSSPGVGTLLALGRLAEIHASPRGPRVQACVASGRLVTGATASAGPREGTSGPTIGQADRTWAFSDAAVLCLRHPPAGQTSRARLTNTPGQGNAVTGLAHPWARAVDDLWTRDPAVALEQWLQASWRGAGAPDAARAAQGIRLP